jgi:hypothetical protein
MTDEEEAGMKMNGQRTAWRRQALKLWGLGTAELAMFLPVWLTVAIYMLPSSGVRAVWLLSLPVLTLCGVLLSFRIAKVWIRGLAAFFPGLVHMLLFYDSGWGALVLFAAGWTVVVRGMAVSSAQSRERIVVRYLAGLLVYIIGYIVAGRLDSWMPYLRLITAGGIVCLVITLFTANGRVLREESFSADDRVAAAVPGLRSHNRRFVAATAAVAIAVAAMASGFLGHWLWLLLRALLRLLLPSGQTAEPPVQAPPPAQPMLPEPSAGEKGWFAQLLEIVFYVVGTAAVCAAAFFIVRTIYRNRRIIAERIGRLWKRLMGFLGKSHRGEETTGYVDEETTLFSWESVQGAFGAKWLKRFAGGRAERWSELRDNRERVRYLYREWLRGLGKRGYKLNNKLTPEETRRDAEQKVGPAADTGAEELVGLYYKARYSGAPITDQELAKAAGNPRSR